MPTWATRMELEPASIVGDHDQIVDLRAPADNHLVQGGPVNGRVSADLTSSSMTTRPLRNLDRASILRAEIAEAVGPDDRAVMDDDPVPMIESARTETWEWNAPCHWPADRWRRRKMTVSSRFRRHRRYRQAQRIRPCPAAPMATKPGGFRHGTIEENRPTA